jgi:TolA-binding protein
MFKGSRFLSIDTESNPSSLSSSVTTTTKISLNQRSSPFQSFNYTPSSTSSVTDVNEIVSKNEEVCQRVKESINKQKVAISELEIVRLKEEIGKMKRVLNKLVREKKLSEYLDFTRNDSCFPQSLPSHKLLALKEKLKEAKQKAKGLKSEKAAIDRENTKLKSIVHDQYTGKFSSCSTF